MKTLAIIGSNGMLGSDFVRYLGTTFRVTPIHKENYHTHVGSTFDIVINANGNSKRFWANTHPADDFIVSTESVYRSIFDFKYGVYVYISSSDVYDNHTSPQYTNEDYAIIPEKLSHYGFHKYISEAIVRRHVKNFLVLRCCLILGNTIKKGPLYDVIHHAPLFITKDSRLQMITTQEISDIIYSVIAKKVMRDVFNVGGIGTFSFRNLDKYFPGPYVYRKDAEKQLYEMRVEKLQKLYPLKTSEEYMREFLRGL